MGDDATDFDFSAEDERFRAELRAFLADELPDDWQGIMTEGDAAWRFSREFCRRLGERGWLTLSWPAEYGGSDATIWRQAVLQEELWAHNEPRGPQYMNVNWLGPALMHFGTEQQKARFLPRISAGDMLWAQGFSEPDAGSDLAALRCRADLVEGGFVVKGQKVWISYGDIAEYCFLLVRSDPGSRRKEGLSVLLVDLSLPGVTRRVIPTTLGFHRQNELFFDDVFVPEEALLGPLHDGWRVAMTALSFERSGSARYARSARVLGFLEREYGAGWHDDQIGDFVDLLAFGRVAELMNYGVMELKERGEANRWRPSAARIHNALLEQGIAAFAEEAGGYSALIGGDDSAAPDRGEIEALVRNAAAGTITAGAYEIQMGIIAREGLDDEGRQ